MPTIPSFPAFRLPKAPAVRTALAGLALSLMAAVPAQADIFAKYKGITGDATDPQHKGWVNIDSMSWGLSVAVDPTRPDSPGRISFSDLSVMQSADRSYLPLFQVATGQKALDLVTLDFTRTVRERDVVFFQMEFGKPQVTSLQMSHSSGGIDLPTVSASFAYSVITLTYTTFASDGVGTSTRARYDLAKGQGSIARLGRLYDRGMADAQLATPVPEPTSLALMAGGLLGVGWVVRRRRAADAASVSAR